MSVEVERLKLEIRFSQPAPALQDDLSPRWSAAVLTGSDEPGVSRAETQKTEQKGTFPLQASIDGFLHVDCTRTLDQEGTFSLQADVGVDNETTNNYHTRHFSRDVCETAEEPAAAKGDRIGCRGNQAVSSGRVM